MRGPALVALLSLLIGANALAQQSAAECARIENDRERLACFDRLFATGGDVGESTTTPGSAEIEARPAEGGFGFRNRDPRDSRDDAAETRREPPPGGEFGLQKSILELGGDSISATAVGSFGFWNPGQRIELSNGQIWQVTNSTGFYFKVNDPQVTIRRGLFSAFYLHVDGISKSLKVKRIR